MSLHLHTLDEKLQAIERLIVEMRGGSPVTSSILKAIAADIRGRQALPRNNVLGALERALYQMKISKTGLGYDEGKMMAVAEVIISRWPTVRQALEQFGEESGE